MSVLPRAKIIGYFMVANREVGKDQLEVLPLPCVKSFLCGFLTQAYAQPKASFLNLYPLEYLNSRNI